jgi:hypothetical protein
MIADLELRHTTAPARRESKGGQAYLRRVGYGNHGRPYNHQNWRGTDRLLHEIWQCFRRISIAPDANDVEKLDLSKIGINANTTEVVPGSPRTGVFGQVAKNGDFQFNHAPEMTLFLSNKTLDETWFIASAQFDGIDVIANGFSTTPGKESTLEVVISNASGTLGGVIKDAKEKPVSAGRLVLLPEPSRRNNPYLTRTAVSIETGAFTIETIPPGEYTAIILPDEDEFTPALLRDLSSIEQYERFGQCIHIGARETTRVDLTVPPIARK